MDSRKARVVFEHLAEHFEMVLIMGGEPTLHPDFGSLYSHAQRCFSQVALFTNATLPVLRDLTPRPQDSITFNGMFVGRGFDFTMMHPLLRYARAVDMVITHSGDLRGMKSRIVAARNGAIAAGIDNLLFTVSLDTSSDILSHRSTLNAHWREVVAFILSIDASVVSYDHPIPRCFWDDESLAFNRSLPEARIAAQGIYPSLCMASQAGLINADFEVLHCSQYPMRVGSLLVGERGDELMPCKEINERLDAAHEMRLSEVAGRPDCSRCGYFPSACNGGCFVARSETYLDMA